MSIQVLFPASESLGEVVAANIRAEAARIGLQQKAIAQLLGLSQWQVSKRWRGLIEWPLGEIATLAGVFGLEPGALRVAASAAAVG